METLNYDVDLIFQVKPRERISAFAGMKHSYFSDLPQSIHTLPDSKSFLKLILTMLLSN